jgi:hypothetical protein
MHADGFRRARPSPSRPWARNSAASSSSYAATSRRDPSAASAGLTEVGAAQFDYQAMGRIFIGLCQVGATACFDEVRAPPSHGAPLKTLQFNRLSTQILSAVSQDIQTIQTGLGSLAKSATAQIELHGKTISVHSNTGAPSRQSANSATISRSYRPVRHLESRLCWSFRAAEQSQEAIPQHFDDAAR